MGASHRIQSWDRPRDPATGASHGSQSWDWPWDPAMGSSHRIQPWDLAMGATGRAWVFLPNQPHGSNRQERFCQSLSNDRDDNKKVVIIIMEQPAPAKSQ